MEGNRAAKTRRLIEIKRYLADMHSFKAKVASAAAGAVAAWPAQIPIHEFGHWIAARAYGLETQFYFLGDRITQQIIYAGDVSPLERGVIAMGGPIAEYVSAFTALMVSRKAGKDSNLKPAAAMYAFSAASNPLNYALTDMGRDFLVISDIGIPKPVQIAVTTALSAPLMYMSFKELYKSIMPVAKRIIDRQASMKR